MRCSRWILGLAAAILAVSASAQAQQWSGVIAPSRAIDWSNAGVIGGIPSRTTICASLSPGATAAQIDAAIQSCPAGQTVFLNAGTYSGLTGIKFANKSNVTLRGAGADQTYLSFSTSTGCHGYSVQVCLDSVDTNYKGAPSNVANWTAGYAKGTTVITLSSTTNLKVGWPIILDQTDDTVDSGDVFENSDANHALTGDGGSPRTGRGEQQIVIVTAINGNQVTISPGLYMPNWTAAKTPQAWWSTSPIFNSGVEDMTIDATLVGTGGTDAIKIFNCVGCWVKGVRSMKPNRSHVSIEDSAHITVRDSYFWENQNHATVSYGLEFIPCSDCLVENNIFEATTAPRMENGQAEGSVLAYNFDVNNAFTQQLLFLNVSDSTHAIGADMSLREGNESAQFYADVEHGSNQFNTAFRNYYNGFQPNEGTTTTSAIIPMPIYAFHRFYNIIGNVLGVQGIQKSYPSSIYGTLGYPNGVPAGFDANVARTILRWGNYDVATGGTRWCGNSSDTGWSTTCAGTSEVPSGITNFANPVPTLGDTSAGQPPLPASFYLPGKPSWWGTMPFPAVGPDVTGGNLPNLGGHVYMNPAHNCYTNVMNGPADGTGAVLTFSAAKCYANSSSSLPASPTGLQAVVY